MEFLKTKFTPWLTASLVSLFFLSGCIGPKVQLGFPLNDGSSWIYQGRLTFKTGRQEQEMPPLTFKLFCRRLAGKPNLPLELFMTREGEPLWKFLLVQSANGIINPLSGELWLPQVIETGKRWTITINNQKIKLLVRGQTTTTVQAGTFPTYQISFKGPGKATGSFWLDPEVGMVMFDLASKAKDLHTSAHLELASYALP